MMNCSHDIIIGDSRKMSNVADESVDLIVTSPPYPMIQMWDDVFSSLNPKIETFIKTDPIWAFELMHRELDCVWRESYRVLKNGGFLCINVGDATRTIDGNFKLYNNHSRIIETCERLRFNSLPHIIWKKQSNSPNKFMGSGMLPNGAYVTLEHEYILIFRKGEKREYKTVEDKQLRRESAFFWEERNQWFSDIWDVKGVKQNIDIGTDRDRSAAFPFEIPYRLINMYSQKGDVVLDPFLGTATTTLAAIASQRNSFGFEIDGSFLNYIGAKMQSLPIGHFNDIIDNRLNRHSEFVAERLRNNKPLKYFNSTINQSVMTNHETDIKIDRLTNLTVDNSNGSVLNLIVNY